MAFPNLRFGEMEGLNFLCRTLEKICHLQVSLSSQASDAIVTSKPFVETLLDEIFSQEREYIIFCSRKFEDVFRAFNEHNKQQNRNINVKSTYHDTQLPGLSKKVSCCILDINYYGQNKKAVIANTFPRQDITNAYEAMAAYGKFCYKCLLSHLP